jgi:hypothetical protein
LFITVIAMVHSRGPMPGHGQEDPVQPPSLLYGARGVTGQPMANPVQLCIYNDGERPVKFAEANLNENADDNLDTYLKGDKKNKNSNNVNKNAKKNSYEEVQRMCGENP